MLTRDRERPHAALTEYSADVLFVPFSVGTLQVGN